MVHVGAAVVALADGLAVGLADACGSGVASYPDDVHAAHSIYFQVLGEHGFVGLLLFVAIGASTWMAARRLVRDFASIPEHKWAADLGTMVQVGMLGYAAGGAFLSLAYFDLPYDLMAVIVAVGAVCRRAAIAIPGTTQGAPALAERPGNQPGNSLA